MKLAQALAERGFPIALDAAAGDEGELAALGDDDAPAGLPETGVDAENTNRWVHVGRSLNLGHALFHAAP